MGRRNSEGRSEDGTPTAELEILVYPSTAGKLGCAVNRLLATSVSVLSLSRPRDLSCHFFLWSCRSREAHQHPGCVSLSPCPTRPKLCTPVLLHEWFMLIVSVCAAFVSVDLSASVPLSVSPSVSIHSGQSSDSDDRKPAQRLLGLATFRVLLPLVDVFNTHFFSLKKKPTFVSAIAFRDPQRFNSCMRAV